MIYTSIRVPAADKQLWEAAAAKEEVSKSDFLRLALRQRATLVLMGKSYDQPHT